MIQIEEKLYNKMPPEVRACFDELPNPERDEVVAGFPETKSGKPKAERTSIDDKNNYGNGRMSGLGGHNDSGSASRFFYCAKSSKAERNKGLEGFDVKEAPVNDFRPTLRSNPENWKTLIQDTPYGGANRSGATTNNHPTVKPIKLMQYLCRLITPKGGIVLDPYMGSGSTGIATRLEGFDFIGIELDESYYKIAEARIKSINKPML